LSGRSGDIVRFVIDGGLAAAERLRGEAREAGVACAEDLEIAARDGSSCVREVALEMLLELVPERAQAVALERLAKDPENEVRGTAARVLSHFDDAAALQSLVGALGGSPAMHMGAEDALRARLARAPKLVRWLLDEYRRACDQGAHAVADRMLVLLAPHWNDEVEAGVRANVERTRRVPERLADALVDVPGEACERTLAFLGAKRALSKRAWCAASPTEAIAHLERFVREGEKSELFYAANTEIRNAVTLAFESDTGFVFDRLAAFALDASRSSEWLTQAIVSELWTRAAAAIRKEGTPPDPRWRGVMNPRIAPEHLASSVALTERAFAYLAGEHRRTRLVEICLPGDEGGPLEPPMPVLLVGVPCAIDDANLRAMRERFLCDDAPPGFAVFRHQYGGFSCMQYALIGYACTPPEALADMLEPLTNETSGEPFDHQTVRELSAAIERVMEFGPIERAHEALIEAAPSRFGISLHGRPVLRFERADSLWNDDVWWASGEEPSHAGLYGAEHDRVLGEIAAALGVEVTVAIAWGNSD
jgi:hypothetical protein